MKRTFLFCCVVLLTLTACQLPSLQFVKDLIQRIRPEEDNPAQPTPDLKIDNAYFAELGCFEDPACLPDDLQRLDPPISSINEPSDILGGLNPVLPLAVGSTVLSRDEVEIPAVYVKRCMRYQFIRYLVANNGEIELVDSIEKLAKIYAPIESSEEALSYAVAATGYTALFDLGRKSKLVFYDPLVETTSVSLAEGNYHVGLFDNYMCGCGPHITRSVEVTVHLDGTIETAEPQDAFSDPEYDGLCID